ncbi:hypothetical protein [Sphingobium sp. Sx8-8]|uniref:DUF3617 domain-containing protein n=1 Tax=Sphingobium sp. Sx8-8 TaxID=2933617 RepID=UPI001F5A7FCD|nr:hypothetical protein [Sphingobium sp. Sx8-8]
MGLRTLISAFAIMAAGWPAQAAPPSPRLAKGLEPGEWELRERGGDGDVRRLCMSDFRQFLQIRHARASCRTFIVSETPTRHVVTYECGAAGNGRTDLRVETARLVQIRSQGIAEGAPFEFAMEGRWIGACH